jgi:hypothetical protein
MTRPPWTAAIERSGIVSRGLPAMRNWAAGSLTEHRGRLMKDALLLPFLVLAGLGLILNLIAHTLAWFAIDNPAGPLTWVLHGGILIVWIPTVFVAQIMTRSVPQRDFWKAVLRGCPALMRRTLYLFWAYALLNFALFALSGSNDDNAMFRGFSGHWMAFYSTAFAALYSATRVSRLDESQVCPNGHRVSPLATFCEICGARIAAGSS